VAPISATPSGGARSQAVAAAKSAAAAKALPRITGRVIKDDLPAVRPLMHHH